MTRFDRGEKMLNEAFLTRRAFVAAGAAVAGSAALLGCSPAAKDVQATKTESAKAFSAGNYTAEGVGKNGVIVVETTFSDDAIEAIRILENDETVGISDSALEQIPQRILDAQSLGVDVVTGATLTSMGILTAVKECAKQADGDMSSLEEPVAKPDPTEESVDADVIVIGAGGAGLVAALTALEAGKRVVLVEKQDDTGGSTRLNGCMFLTTADEAEQAEGALDVAGAQQFFANNGNNGYFNKPMVDELIDQMTILDAYVLEHCYESGRHIDPCYAPFDPSDPESQNPFMVHLWPADWQPPESYYNEVSDHFQDAVPMPEGIGWRFTKPLEEEFVSEGGVLLTGTAVVSIDKEADVIVGVTAKSNQNVTYTIRGKAVVVASGGYGANAEWTEKYWGEVDPAEWGQSTYFGAPSNDGACITYAENCGAKTVFVDTPGGYGGPYATQGGLVIDADAHVLDEHDQPIANLFAAGEVCDVYLPGPAYIMSGTMNQWSVYTGQIAGRGAAAL
ncbi:FAD-dependent oxidoreductase [Adlercreutzia sp. R25]|uniref:Urocanate reductase n=1 Tax=Adlercreutzia shanghongiae TaxID=3111773 RepID=A0ABU6IYC7_9ACTN|nr:MULTISPECIES: FAD-dependent oxidoreductase [unclassified Adlercreutzia]MEC4272493.1 FAD-dependent oxidoreductase [Adlercreutzia sp. R25]MEC4294607.1 FAD-dependent oxidoreductase [Adlercreutzia sp. R22]